MHVFADLWSLFLCKNKKKTRAKSRIARRKRKKKTWNSKALFGVGLHRRVHSQCCQPQKCDRKSTKFFLEKVRQWLWSTGENRRGKIIEAERDLSGGLLSEWKLFLEASNTHTAAMFRGIQNWSQISIAILTNRGRISSAESLITSTGQPSTIAKLLGHRHPFALEGAKTFFPPRNNVILRRPTLLNGRVPTLSTRFFYHIFQFSIFPHELSHVGRKFYAILDPSTTQRPMHAHSSAHRHDMKISKKFSKKGKSGRLHREIRASWDTHRHPFAVSCPYCYCFVVLWFRAVVDPVLVFVLLRCLMPFSPACSLSQLSISELRPLAMLPESVVPVLLTSFPSFSLSPSRIP